MVTPPFPIPEAELHDATLDRVTFYWERGEVELLVRSRESSEIRIVAQGTARLSITRRLEWGPSCSINQLSVQRTDRDELQTVLIEMQSGDVLTIEAERFVTAGAE